QFEYKANSNLVLQAERDKRSRAGEATGEVESLHGKTRGMRMGDKVVKERAPEFAEKLKKAQARREKRGVEEKIRSERERKRQKVFVAGKGATVISETAQMDSINYRPKTRESRIAYEEMLSQVQASLGNQPQDIIKGAAEEVLSILKDESLKDPERHADIEKLLSKVKPEKFARMVSLGKQIRDFQVGDEEEEKVDVDDEDAGKLDEDMGVAVVFDDEEEGEDSGVDEVVDSDSDDLNDDDGEETRGGRQLKGGVNSEVPEEEEELGAVSVHDIDAHWLQRSLSKYYDDADVTAKLAEEVLALLGNADERACENSLVLLLEFDKFDLIKVLLKNRAKLYYCTRLKQAQTDEERQVIEEEMFTDAASGGPSILAAIKKTESASTWNQDRVAAFGRKTQAEARALARGEGAAEVNAGGIADEDEGTTGEGGQALTMDMTDSRAKKVDLEAMTFQAGSHFMSNSRCELPDKSWRAQKKGYEEVHVPALKHVPPAGEKLIPISALPEWTHAAFAGMEKLNRIQSKMHEAALTQSDNLLLCAPTGAGKTNVAMLTMLHEIGQHRKEDGSIDTSAFKIVYVAPMKALVQEVVQNFGKRLQSYGIVVKELSGDVSLSRTQLAETQIIVTTPEKWDVVTRKSGERTFTQLVRLIIIDEIHLLHDERGPVLESLVARTIRQIEATREMVRLVGLSATLPNYDDVANFLRVDPLRGLFFFDNSFRPVPLQQQYIGVSEKKAIKRFQLMNEICYEKVMAQAGKNQVLIFVHSRAETAKTAKFLKDLVVENDVGTTFFREDSATAEILRSEAEGAKNDDLKEMLPFGFAIHHAGMSRADRNLVEDLFHDKHVQVLCSTATLAWGVNLPAHTVIIKGTQMYSPEKGEWVELSPLDVLQMMGRAGRPQFDTEGEGIILTNHSELQYYLSLNNQQLPVESQYIKKIHDHMNAEIVRGTISNVAQAVDWLGYTYLYIRMMRAPEVYGVRHEAAEDDSSLALFRLGMVKEAAEVLEAAGLIKFDRRGGGLQATPLGRVASFYYLTHRSVSTFREHLKPHMSEVELFRLFSWSEEFKNIHVREEEKLEMQKLLSKVPVPIKEPPEDSSAKINALLQAYISNLKLDGFALVSDMVYVQQSAARILRALFEIALKNHWAQLSDKIIMICKMVERRCWLSQSPLRQFKSVPEPILRKLERKEIGKLAMRWDRYYDLKATDLGELVKLPKMGRNLYKLVHQVPRVELQASVQPITPGLLRVEVTVQPDFQFDVKVHDYSQLFHVFVTDVDGFKLLHHEQLMIKQHLAEEEHHLSFTVPLTDPLPPQYFIRIVSDRWLHSEATLPVSFRHLILPKKYPPHTELLDLQPLPVGALNEPAFEALYREMGLQVFNPIQTQAFSELYQGSENVLLCAPTGSGKTVCAEFALMRLFRTNPSGRAVYIAPKTEIGDRIMSDWKER
ncbi:unnamed protein product, partial [Chrysoparadoxa australica]